MLIKYPGQEGVTRQLEEAAELVAQSIRRMAPAAAVVVEPVRDLTSRLYPSEDAAVAGSVTKRRIEFSTGRYCARRALALLDIVPGPIPAGPGGEPIWPPGVSASLSHSRNLCAAVAAPSRLAHALGLDLEWINRVQTSLLPHIATPQEVARNRTRIPEAWLPACLFSIQEAVFKAYNPVTKVSLHREDIDIDVDGREQTFQATLTDPAHPSLFGERVIRGRFAVVEGFIATLALVAGSLPGVRSPQVPAPSAQRR
jgi:4'-phosphopantetheinyl transferase EntD